MNVNDTLTRPYFLGEFEALTRKKRPPLLDSPSIFRTHDGKNGTPRDLSKVITHRGKVSLGES